MKTKSIFLLLSCVLAFTSCQKNEKTIEKEVVTERKADPQISESMKVKSDSNQIELSKKSLGKAFLLIPSMKTSGRQPTVEYIKPLVVSFEKSGNQIALFNLTEQHLYSTISSDRLLQTFEIASEDDSTLKINLGKGFSSLLVTDNLGYLEKSIFTNMLEKIQSGNETSIEVKDSFVRSVSSNTDSIFIEQVMRLKSSQIKEKPDPTSATQNKKIELETSENSSTVIVEIKPYVQNTNFKSKVYDKEQRLGYFLNFAVVAQSDDPIPQITYWDTSDTQEPITVHLFIDTPPEVITSMQEGVLYWNRVFGKQIFKIAEPFTTDSKQKDRSIFIYWVPWDSAGFARANFQADPITGEIFRGQVFMTSSWYKSTKAQFSVPINTDDLSSMTSKCNLNQSLYESAIALAQQENAVISVSENAERLSQDTIRIVVAHEMGHALGLRHNFTGTFSNSATDDEILTNTKTYLSAENKNGFAASTTVMDYTPSIATAMNGAFIKNSIMPYDQNAISWAYLNHDIKLDKYNYCSDEHIMIANNSKKSIYGCERFDIFKNPMRGAVESLIISEKNKTMINFLKVIMSAASAKSNYTNSMTIDNLVGVIDFSFYDVSNLTKYIYEDTSSTFVTIPTIIDSFLASLTGASSLYDSKISELIKNDSKNLNGLTGIIDRLLALQLNSNNQFYQIEAEHFLKDADYTELNKLFSKDDLQKITDKILSSAKKADQTYLINVLKGFPLSNSSYTLKEGGVAGKLSDYVVKEQFINSDFDLGDTKKLFNLYLKAYASSLSLNSKKIQVNGTEIEFTYGNSGDSNLDFLVKPFSKASWSTINYYKVSSDITENKAQLKNIAVKNLLNILKSLNIETPVIISTENLKGLLDQIDWTKINGITSSDLSFEVEQLKKIEALE